jgi:hypothetical protein
MKKIRTYLLDIANEQGIEVEDIIDIHPANLAHTIFKVVPEVRL